MEYARIEMEGLAPDEFAVQVLSTGQRAAVRLARPSGVAPSMFGFTACAFAIEADGSPTLTAAIKTVEGHHTVSCMKVDLLSGGVLDTSKVESLKDECIRAALSEMASVLAAEQANNILGV